MFERIKEFCEDVGITIEQFERVIKVSAGYTYKLKKDHKPSYKVARKIAVLLDTTIEDFVESKAV